MAVINGVARYRIVWSFSGTKNTNDEFKSSSSPSFKMCRSDFRIVLSFKTLPTGNVACSFYLQSDFPIGPTRILRCCYYMVNKHTSKHDKIANFSPYLTDWFDLGVAHDTIEFELVFALDFNCESPENSEFWLTGRTEATRVASMYFVSGHYCALFSGKQYRLKFISERSYSKDILMDGLNENEIICANFQTVNSRSDGTERNHQVNVRSFATNCDIRDCEQINKIELLSISADFKKMNGAQISKYARIIENINSIENAEQLENIGDLETSPRLHKKRATTPSNSYKQVIINKIYKKTKSTNNI